MKNRLQRFLMRIVVAAIPATVFVGLVWLGLHLGCSNRLIACVDVTTEIAIWGFLVATFGFYFYRPGRTRLSQLKDEHHRKFGGGNRYFNDHNRPDRSG